MMTRLVTLALLLVSLSGQAAPPKLVVMLVFDQMRGDYLSRWKGEFGTGGFARLCSQGVWWDNAHYPYAMTVTAAGHATIATGVTPDVHGIVGNDWIDYSKHAKAYCVESERWELQSLGVTLTDQEGKPRAAGSPEKLLVPTVGDLLKESSPNSRVFSISAKDRSAILMAGKKADGCFWLDSKKGQIVSSSFFPPFVPDWFRSFVQSDPAGQWFGKEWNKLRTDIDYVAFASADDQAGEGVGKGQGKVFPHPFSAKSTTKDEDYYESVAISPMGNDLLVDLAIELARREKLGLRDVPDLLAISFSSNDLVGHNWGPDSQEVLDITLRSDQQVRRLLDFFDEHVGRGNYIVTLSADHGVCPLPERLQQAGTETGRLTTEEFSKQASKYLSEKHSAPPTTQWIDDAANMWITLKPSVLAERHLDLKEVATDLAQWCRSQRGVARVYTRWDLEKPLNADDPFEVALRKSYLPDRVGEVCVIPKPYYFFAFAMTGTSHGTPYEYDTHVPVIALGPGLAPGVRSERASPEWIAPIILRSLGVNIPAHMRSPIPSEIFRAP